MIGIYSFFFFSFWVFWLLFWLYVFSYCSASKCVSQAIYYRYHVVVGIVGTRSGNVRPIMFLLCRIDEMDGNLVTKHYWSEILHFSYFIGKPFITFFFARAHTLAHTRPEQNQQRLFTLEHFIWATNLIAC